MAKRKGSAGNSARRKKSTNKYSRRSGSNKLGTVCIVLQTIARTRRRCSGCRPSSHRRRRPERRPSRERGSELKTFSYAISFLILPAFTASPAHAPPRGGASEHLRWRSVEFRNLLASFRQSHYS